MARDLYQRYDVDAVMERSGFVKRAAPIKLELPEPPQMPGAKPGGANGKPKVNGKRAMAFSRWIKDVVGGDE